MLQLAINSAALLAAVNQAIGLISTKPVLPILENVLLQVEKGVVTLFSSNMEAQLTTRVACDSMPLDEFQICLPAKLLQTTLSNLPSQPITLTIDLETFATDLKASKGKYRIAGENPVDWPRPTPTKSRTALQLEGPVLATALQTALPFVWSDATTRANMAAVLLDLLPDGVAHAVACDGFRVSVHRLRLDSAHDPAQYLIPTAAAKQLATLAGKAKQVQVQLGDWLEASAATGEWSLSVRLIDERFPPYLDVLPTENPYSLLVQRAELAQALRRVAAFANPVSQQMLLTVCEGEELRLSAESTEYGNDADERIACTYTGEEQSVCFNAKLFEQALSALPGEEIHISMNTPYRPVLMRSHAPAEGQPTTEVMLMTVVPLVAA